jgi:TonB family protein
VAVTEAFETIELVIGEVGIADGATVDDDRVEPTLAAAPFFVEFDEPIRLDPKRIGLTWEVPPPLRTGLRPLSSLGSLLFHLLPFLLLIMWPTPTNEGPALIPIQLVIQEPPPPAPEVPQPPKPPTQGRLASEDMGDVKPKTTGTAPTAAPPAPGEKQPSPNEAQTAAAATAPLPPPPKPTPSKEHAPVQLPKLSGLPAPKTPDPPHEAPHAATYAGPMSSRDEYLAYLVTLTKQHLDLLPMSVVGTRRGETVVSVTVQDNGTISHIAVARSSGYPDIDQRIQQMVAAVQKFPPVPQWFQGNTIELELRLRFPEALEREH